MKTIGKIKEYSWAIIMTILLLIYFQQCGRNRDISKINKSIKENSAYIDSTNEAIKNIVYIEPVSKEEIKYEMEQMMYQFLIYEDDIDKGRISLSAVKIKMEEHAK